MIRTIAQGIFKAGPGDGNVNLPQTDATDFVSVLQIVLVLAGTISLIVVVIAGFQYTLSQGDPGKTAKAKNAIIYALIGLALCALSFSIVSFVIKEV